MSDKTRICESEYDFTLILGGVNELNQEIENALFEAGCSDATASVRFGRVYLTFARTARTLGEAILSAIQDVRNARIGADVLRVDPCNLVTQSEIAHRIRRTRQLVHQYIIGVRGPGGFPPPVCHIADESPLWAWCEVAYWLLQNGMITEKAVRDAQQLALINAALEFKQQRKLAPDEAEEILRSVASNSG